MITELTPEQEAHINVVCEKWTKKALNPVPIKKTTASKITKAIYKTLGENVPKFVIAPSPVAAWEIVCRTEATNDDEYADLKRQIIQPSIDGICSAGYYGYVEYFEYLGLNFDDVPEVVLFKQLADVSWVWPLKTLCVFSDHPLHIKVNDQGQLHNESGPSVKYSDGYSLWDINGIEVDEQIVASPATQSLETILKDTNADRQAIRIERYGWLRFLKEINATVVDERPNETEGTYEVLYKTIINGREGRRLVATCITGKIPVMGVPANINKCAQAQEWIAGPQKLNLIGRT